MMDGFTLFVVACLVLAVVLVIMGVKMVPQAEEWVVERFGKYTHTISPGLHVIIPVVDRIGAKISMREGVYEVPSQDVITKDNAMVRADGVVFFQVLDAAKAAYEVAGLEKAILNLTMTNIRTVMGSMDLDQLLSHREEINASLLRVVDDATHPWGVKVTRIEIKDIHPPKDLVDSMARQMKAEREKRAAVLEAQGHREAQVLRAEGEKKAQIMEAEARRETVILEAEARKKAAFLEAEGRERLADAEAFATRSMTKALEEGKGSREAVNYFIAQKYVEAISDIAVSPNQKLFFMPLEAANLMGALGGIAELTKDVFQGKDGGKTKKD
jgi:regulator of protease activity HflC (stomatin/prohibitin superfamily)